LAYVQVVRGQLDLNGKKLGAGDGAKIADEKELQFLAGEEAEFLLFDLPPQV
jgi:redox-sensitive bicupin YhaK (pirin superfamily)